MTKVNTVPVLGAHDIELKAEEVISYFDPKILERPQLTPLRDFIEELHRKFGLIRDYSCSLGTSGHGGVIIGKTQLKPLGLFVDRSLNNDPRFNFVLGHEFGHIVLHKFVDVKRTGYEGQEIIDTKIDLPSGKKILNTPRDWLEWQANRFSSAILMPRATVRDAVVEVQKQIGITRNIGLIILENVSYSIKDYKTIRRYLENIYKVNSTNVEYRLNDLGILIDRRDLNVKHISELFSIE